MAGEYSKVDWSPGDASGVLSSSFWNTVLQCDAVVQIPIPKLLELVCGACFSTGGMFECNIAHRRSLAVLCMLYKISFYMMHPIFGVLPVPYVQVWVIGASVY